MNTTVTAKATNAAWVESQRAKALTTIEGFNRREDLIEFYERLQKPQNAHISDLAEMCLDKCIDKGLLHGNYARLPPPLPQDLERVDLRRSWLKVIALTNKCSLATINSVGSKGYLQAMLNQIDDIKNIGSAGFLRLKEDRLLHHSAEYLMLKHFRDRLREDQIAAIEALLAANNILIAD